MKRVAIIIGLCSVFGAVACTSMSVVTPASAESCFEVVHSEQGAFFGPSCRLGGPPYIFVWGSDTFNWEHIDPKLYCVKVKTALPSWYEDAVCSKLKETTSLYSLVWAEPGYLWGINPISGKAKGVQKFHTTAGAIECSELTLSAEPSATEENSQVFKAKYGKCEAFGGAATVSEAEYEMTAEGDVSIVNKNITVTDTGTGCTVTIPSGSSNADLEKSEYTNTAGGKIDDDESLSGIHYEPSGGACGTKTLEGNGSYEGESELEQEGKTIEVKLHARKDAETEKLEKEENERVEKESWGPKILPESGQAWTGKLVSSTDVLEKHNGEKVSCKGMASEGIGAYGAFHMHLKECTGPFSSTCTGLGEESGVILMLGSWHLVYDVLKASLSEAGVAVLFLLSAVHFVCKALSIEELVAVSSGGMTLCLVSNPTTAGKSHEFTCKENGKKEPEETKYYNQSGTLVSIHRAGVTKNEGAEEEATSILSGTVSYPESVEIMV